MDVLYMQLGAFKVPEIRLDIILDSTLKKIYESVKTDQIQSKDLSSLLGYTHGTEPTLFKRIHSMLAYGILEGRGIYSITKLGEDLLFPEPDKENELRTQAILNVELWQKLFKKYGKELPKAGLWVQLKNMTGIDPDTAKKLENRISNWYTADMELVSDDVVMKEDGEEESQPEDIGSSSTQNNQMKQQSVSLQLQNNEDNELIQFGKVSLVLPKKDLKKQWDKLQKYMEIYLEDYVEEPKEVVTKKHDSDLEHAQCPNCKMVAKNMDEVEKLFGFRTHNGKQSIQSWCIECRKSSNMIN